MVPVSATPKLTPEMPTSASAKLRRRMRRAAPVSTATSSVGSMPTFSANSSAICRFDLWMAGTTMCDGVSCASWMIHSPRSVSTGASPSASSAAFRCISSVAMLFDLTTFDAPRARINPRTTRQASAPSRAQ
jgi:hypothetical protein